MAAETTFGILFHTLKSKTRKDGKVPIYMRLTIEGKRTEYALKRFIEPKRWNPEAGKARGTNDESQEINSYIHSLINRVHKAQKELIDEGVTVDGPSIIRKITDKYKKEMSLLETFEWHNRLLKERVGVDYAPATYTRFETTLQHVKDFLKHEYDKTDIPLNRLNLAFAYDLEKYFKVTRSCNHNSTMKYIKNLKRIIHFAMERDWLQNDPFRQFKANIEEVKRDYLTEEELSTLKNKDVKVERYRLVRDIFLFSCWTGLAYIDVVNLTRDKIEKGIDSKLWIIFNRQKTNTTARIPLLPMALEIMEKYSGHPLVVNTDRVLPIYSNQKMNSYLKDLAAICEVDKNLTFHLARHTFATTMLKNGASIESVSAMLGQKNIRTTQIYAKIVAQKISEDMATVEAKLSSKQSNNSKTG